MKTNKVKTDVTKSAVAVGDLNPNHLHAELQRIDLLIQREVRRFQLAGQDPLDTFRGLFISDAKANALVARPFATSWGQTVALGDDEARAIGDLQQNAARQSQSISELANQHRQVLRLQHLARTFSLSAFDVDALLISLAPTLDLRYERLYGYLQDDVTKKRPSISLVLDLLSEGSAERLPLMSHFADSAPLFRYRILHKLSEPANTVVPLLSQTLYSDDAVVSWLLGDYHPSATLAPHVSLSVPRANALDALLAGENWHILERAHLDNPILMFYGPDADAQAASARQLVASLRRPMLRLDLASAMSREVSGTDAIVLAARDAELNGAVLIVVNWDAALADGEAQPQLLSLLIAHPDICVVASRTPWQPSGVSRERNFLTLEFGVPAYAQRQALWSYFLQAAQPGADLDLSILAGQFNLTSDQIRDAVATA
ncbi:MAG: hypothetical protein LC737_06390, partial [Chloroflexi bacterium]|nr:hypothetical protein [Chloroflexota bacterium]